MKKITFALMALLAFSFSLRAQQYVSTDPANRNVILEEFTGRTCTWCPAGHVIANQIKAQHPDRFWSVNIHSNGYFSATSYPNLNTEKGNQIRAAFNATSFPSGVVNRSTASYVGRGEWTGLSNTQFNQPAECNVAGMAVVNPATRVATITVEVYYTGSSAVDENYLTVCMLQDSILGSQTGMGDNPSQVIGNQYCHMHVLRDIVTNVMGDAISPTTQGTLITRTYVYEIPEVIGTPNGVEVDLENIHFLAWVSERYQGTPTRPILNAGELEMAFGSDEPIYPYIKSVAQQEAVTCSHSKVVEAVIQNGGTETLTSIELEATVEGQSFGYTWEGSLAQNAMTTVEIPVDVPFGDHTLTVAITEANGQPFQFERVGTVNCMEWSDLVIEGDEEELKLELMQDKFGNQITWDIVGSDGSVLGSGGPYPMLAGGSATQFHLERITVPANECIKFTIRDIVGNGICCAYGQGYFILKDSQGNVIVGDENDGEFGSEFSCQVSVRSASGVVVNVGETEVAVNGYTEADFASYLEADMFPDEVGFVYRKVTSSEQNSVVGIINEFKRIFASVDDLEHSSIYVVKAYAVVNGETFYGQETTFQTWMENVNELENSVKLYPNPTSSLLNIEGEGMASVEVYNAVGQRVMTKDVSGNAVQVNTESLNNGIYIVRIMGNDGTVLNRTFTVAR